MGKNGCCVSFRARFPSKSFNETTNGCTNLQTYQARNHQEPIKAFHCSGEGQQDISWLTRRTPLDASVSVFKSLTKVKWFVIGCCCFEGEWCVINCPLFLPGWAMWAVVLRGRM